MYPDSEKIQRYLSRLANGNVPAYVDFVTPLIAVSLLGGFKSLNFDANRVVFTANAKSYAENYGLLGGLGLASEFGGNGGGVGLTYCPVQKIGCHDHVNHCNGIVSSLLRSQLSSCQNKDLIRATCGVIGEIHDNVASHARGVGYSAAQVYRGKRNCIQIAVADTGRGIGDSVRSSGNESFTSISDDDALLWCLKRGNTCTKLSPIPVADLIGPQRLDPYSNYNPYPENVSVVTEDNHHMGEGLYRLTELIRQTGGKTWIWSGKASVLCDNNITTSIPSLHDWCGTLVAIEIPIDAFQTCIVAQSDTKYEDLARRLGI